MPNVVTPEGATYYDMPPLERASAFAEQVTLSFLAGGAIALLGVCVGAFLRIRPRRSSATSAPECLPIDACAESKADTELATAS
jgi:hypothetical protein